MIHTGVYGVGSLSSARKKTSFLGRDTARNSPSLWRRRLGVWVYKCVLARQIGASHQELVHGTGALPAFADGPDHKRLAAAHVPGGKNAGHRRVISLGAFGGCFYITTRILLHPELLDQSGPDRA